MKPKVDLLWSVSEPHLANVELLQDGKVMGRVKLDAADLGAIIEALSQARQSLAEEVPRELDPGTRLHAVINPVWRAEEHPEGALLSLRHPGLGWLHAVFPPKEARAIGNLFAKTGKAEKG